MDDVQKIATIHLIPGIIVGFLSAMISYGTFGFKNEALASIIGFIVLYFIGRYCQDHYADSIDGFRQWFMMGIVPFIFGWFSVWVLLLNYADFVPFL